MSRRFEQTVG